MYSGGGGKRKGRTNVQLLWYPWGKAVEFLLLPEIITEEFREIRKFFVPQSVRRWWIWVSAGNRSKLPETPPMCLQMDFQLLLGLVVKIWGEGSEIRRCWVSRFHGLWPGNKHASPVGEVNWKCFHTVCAASLRYRITYKNVQQLDLGILGCRARARNNNYDPGTRTGVQPQTSVDTPDHFIPKINFSLKPWMSRATDTHQSLVEFGHFIHKTYRRHQNSPCRAANHFVPFALSRSVGNFHTSASTVQMQLRRDQGNLRSNHRNVDGCRRKPDESREEPIFHLMVVLDWKRHRKWLASGNDGQTGVYTSERSAATLCKKTCQLWMLFFNILLEQTGYANRVCLKRFANEHM